MRIPTPIRSSLRTFGLSASLFSTIALSSLPAAGLASAGSAAGTLKAQASAAKLTLIQTRGDAEITRRLTSLNKLDGKVSGAEKLSSANKSILTNEVNTEVSGLMSLKSKLDGDIDASTAQTDAQSIISDYRVYALLLPKVDLVRVADDQMVVTAKLSTLVTGLTAKITSDSAAGKNIGTAQATFDDFNKNISAAEAIDTSIESKVIALQPSDYDADHTILSGDRDQLVAAQANISAALTDAKTLISEL